MAAEEVQRRRGTAAQCDAMTPAEGEIVIDTTNDRARIGDGSRAGGYPVPNFNDVQRRAFFTGTVGGTADVITLTLTPAPSAYTDLGIEFKASATNTGAVTININGLGAVNVYAVKSGALGALTAGDIVAGVIYRLVYDGTQFQIISAAGGTTQASTSEVATQTAVTKYISPDRLRYSPLVPKCVATISGAGSGSPSIVYGQNVASISTITGGIRITFTNAMSGTSYHVQSHVTDNTESGSILAHSITKTTGYVDIATASTGTRYIKVIIFE